MKTVQEIKDYLSGFYSVAIFGPSQYFDCHYIGSDQSAINAIENTQEYYVMFNYFTAGDYCGSTVERSNYKYMEENYSKWFDAGLMQYHSEAYGTDSILIKVTALKNEELRELLDALIDYPLIDDSLHSDMLCEAENEDWSDYIRDDIIREIENKFDHLTDEELSNLVDAAYSSGLINLEEETGGFHARYNINDIVGTLKQVV